MFGVALAALSAAGCSSKAQPVTIVVTAGLDGAPFDGTPAVANVQLRVRAQDGTEKTLSTTPLSANGVDVPDSAKTGIGALALYGLDATNAPVAWGRTPPLDLGGLQSQLTIALAILVQRPATLVRAVNLGAAVASPRCALLGTQYMLIADASSTSTQVFDALSVTAHAETAAWPSAPVTVAVAGSTALGIDASGVGTIIDFDQQTSTTATAPAGSTFAEVSGGKVVMGEDGSAWIVGATRASSPTDAVLRVGTDGSLAMRHLLRARTGAAATWVAGRGLVVAYGDVASGDPAGAAGIEVLAPSATTAASLAFPGKTGAPGVIAPLDPTHVVRVAPDGSAWSIDLGCAAGCMEASLGSVDAARTARADDDAIPLANGIVLFRGGAIGLLAADGKSMKLLQDSGPAALCGAALSTGAAAIAVAGDTALRTVQPFAP